MVSNNAVTVRAGIRIHPDEPTDVMLDLESRALVALEAMVERERALVAKLDVLVKHIVSLENEMHDKNRLAVEAQEQRDEALDGLEEWKEAQIASNDATHNWKARAESAEADLKQLSASIESLGFTIRHGDFVRRDGTHTTIYLWNHPTQ